MSNKMLIDAAHPEETRVVVLRGNKVDEFDHESLSRRQLRGNIYLAKVTRVEPSLQAAFVDFGGNRHGFLAFSEIHPDYYQIPVADRQALLDEEAEEASRAAAEDAQDDDDAPEDATEAESEEQLEAKSDQTDASAEIEASDESSEEDNEDIVETQASSEEETTEAASTSDDDTDEDPKNIALIVDNEDAKVTSDDPVENEEETSADASADDDGDKTEEVVEAAAEEVSSEATSDATSDADETDSDDEEESVKNNVAEAHSRDHHADDAVESVGSEDVMEEVPTRVRKRRRNYKIQEVIKRRQIILVQVVKEERGNKGAALTTYLSMAGRYTVLMPNTARGGGISRKITNHTDRRRLRKIANDLEVPEGTGLIIRTAGASRTKAEIKRDFEYLLRLWENVRDLTLQSTAPALVYEEGSLIKRSIRDLYSKEIDEVLVAGDDAYREAKDFMRMLMPSHAKNVQPYKEPDPLFVRHRIERQLNSMFSPNVTLRSGGYIVINQTEALVAIDVNSGKATKEHSIEETALKTNLEAADEIARQLRLRDLAGLIVIDFIDMEEKRNNRSVERRMKDCLRNDRARIQIGRISHFGLLEMSRQRLRTGVLEGSTEPCPHCMGTGTIRSTESVSLSILRALEDSLLNNQATDLSVTTSIEVALYILNQKRPYLKDIEARYGVTISVNTDENLHGANFTIERISRTDKDGAATSTVVQMDWAHHDQSTESEGDRKRGRRRRGRGSRSNNDNERSSNTEQQESSDQENQEQAASSEDADETTSREANRRGRRRGRRGGRRNRGGQRNREAAEENDSENATPVAEQSSDVESQSEAPTSDNNYEVAKEADADKSFVTADASGEKADKDAVSAETVDGDAEDKPKEKRRRTRAKDGEKPKRRRTRKTSKSDDDVEKKSKSQTDDKPSKDAAAPEADNASPNGKAASPSKKEPAAKASDASNKSQAPAAKEEAKEPETDGPPAKPKRGWWQRRLTG